MGKSRKGRHRSRVEQAGERRGGRGRVSAPRRGDGEDRGLRRLPQRPLGSERNHPAASPAGARPRGRRRDRGAGRRRRRRRRRRPRRDRLGAHVREVPLLRRGSPGTLRHVRQGRLHAARRHLAPQGPGGQHAQPLRGRRGDDRVRHGAPGQRGQDRSRDPPGQGGAGRLRGDDRRGRRPQHRQGGGRLQRRRVRSGRHRAERDPGRGARGSREDHRGGSRGQEARVRPAVRSDAHHQPGQRRRRRRQDHGAHRRRSGLRLRVHRRPRGDRAELQRHSTRAGRRWSSASPEPTRP